MEHNGTTLHFFFHEYTLHLHNFCATGMSQRRFGVVLLRGGRPASDLIFVLYYMIVFGLLFKWSILCLTNFGAPLTLTEAYTVFTKVMEQCSVIACFGILCLLQAVFNIFHSSILVGTHTLIVSPHYPFTYYWKCIYIC
jgi:hypothetical protein